MAKEIEIQCLEERKAVRKIYKSAHCRPLPNNKGFYVYYTDDNKEPHFLASSEINRADAWKNAAFLIGEQVVKKLEQ